MKKVSFYKLQPTPVNYGRNGVTSIKTHWKVIWDKGVTEGGSSGSPLLNKSKRIIGQLHGGHSYCVETILRGIPVGPKKPDWYGRLNISWTGSGNSDKRRRLDHWLDPRNTGQQTLDGIEYTPPPPFYLESSSELWGFCKRATFTIVNFPEGAEVSWRFTRGATIVEEKVPNELVIDFGTKRRAIVEAEVRVAGETYNLRYENTNNMHVRNEHVHLHIKEHLPNGEFVAEILLDEQTPLTDVEAKRFTILNTENCSVRRAAFNRYYINVLRGNAKVSFSISAVPEPCEEDIATFTLDYIEPSSLIATDESQIISTLPKNDIANCTTKGLLQGEVYVYRWQGARRVFLDFKEKPNFIPMSDEEKYQSINWNEDYSKIAEKYPNGYFECVPIDGNLSYMYPLPHIDVQPGEIHYDSPRYVGFLDWGKAWVRFVTDCKASEWELIDFSKIIHVTNGYFVSRDKGYAPGGVFRITPNPASNNVYLSVFNSEQGKSGFRSASLQRMNKNVETPYKIRIYNSAGMLVRSLEGKGNSAHFSVKGLPTGIYIVHFVQNGKTHKEKLIVE